MKPKRVHKEKSHDGYFYVRYEFKGETYEVKISPGHADEDLFWITKISGDGEPETKRVEFWTDKEEVTTYYQKQTQKFWVSHVNIHGSITKVSTRPLSFRAKYSKIEIIDSVVAGWLVLEENILKRNSLIQQIHDAQSILGKLELKYSSIVHQIENEPIGTNPFEYYMRMYSKSH